ncbi:RagB/SusD family nutrient uptake outer membrane protein [Tenuifilum thalassicum]|uniref:RagB/SusD family nutrient uptake outer membrane protein n=1 Tax=Tenuifilum thalassicum TaxID=2590900 RepID=A0A7D4C104_9BACT|nr:RagB/SusD family nutrient uptake outer membrane protein [Tenuifilum thalassicum]QKG80404.1 RagB/SusD family nutrient uptake outer membrane protein [Tenuifilum thalassicum]
MKRKFLIFTLLVGLMVSCSEDFLETSPSASISDDKVFTNLEGAKAVIDGVTRDLREYHSYHDQFGVKAIDLASDLMGEDIVVGRLHWFRYDYTIDNREATYRRPSYVWSLFYRSIRNLNEVLAHYDEVTNATDVQKKHIKAQALTLRAYSYFRLIQHFQQTYMGHQNDPGVPIYTEPKNEGNPRATVQQVYDLITADLDEAITLFGEANIERRDISEVDLSVAHGIRARVALVMNDWSAAASHANAARQGYALNTIEQFESGFDNAAQMVWMWGLPLNDEQSTIYASFFSHLDMTIGGYAGLGYSPKYLCHTLYSQMQPGDIRRDELLIPTVSNSVNVYVNLKFSSANDKEFAADYVMMRPEEMLLIEAEARARMGGPEETTAQNLLQELWNVRFYTPPTVTETGQALIDRILLERRIELWGEGFAFYDIMRLKKGLNRTNHIFSAVPGNVIPAEDPVFIYKIPQTEIDNNPAISEADQNP